MDILALSAPVRRRNNHPSIQSAHLRYPGDERSGADAGSLALDRPRRQLSHSPTLVLHRHAL